MFFLIPGGFFKSCRNYIFSEIKELSTEEYFLKVMKTSHRILKSRGIEFC